MSLAFASETTERDPLFDREVVAAQPSLLRSALGYVRGRDAAEDLVQTVILKALRNHHSFMPGTNLRAWLQTILINTVRSDHRKAKREVEDPRAVKGGRRKSRAPKRSRNGGEPGGPKRAAGKS